MVLEAKVRQVLRALCPHASLSRKMHKIEKCMVHWWVNKTGNVAK
jgi:hypothetical protein